MMYDFGFSSAGRADPKAARAASRHDLSNQLFISRTNR